MTPQHSDTADKFIVDRTRRRRNSEVERAVRTTRERLSHKSGDPDFNRDMLKLHARAILASAPAIPLAAVAVALAGRLAGMDERMALWVLITLVCHVPLYLIARRIDRSERNAVAVAPSRRWLFAAHFLAGLGWAYFATLQCPACGVDALPVIQAAILLAAIAGMALVTAALSGALVATFALPVCLYALTAAELSQTVYLAMAVLLAVSLPFFAYLAHSRNRAALHLLSFRSEKDGLIAQLETAKAMSDEARRRAEEANLAKSRFLASMSHELRTPLNAILGFSEVMAGEVLGPIENKTYRDYAKDIHDSGRHLLDLINEILDLSRIEAGRYQLNEEPLSLTAIVEDCCRLMELKAHNKDIRLVLQAEPSLLHLFADERAIRQIALNLLSNAIKFAPGGSAVEIRVGWTAGGGQYLAVRDHGPGIAEEELSLVRSAFGQGSIAIKSAEQGTGLGLPIVQGLADLHGGAFELKSKLRQGTEAIVAFPRARVMEELPAEPTPARAAAGGRN